MNRLEELRRAASRVWETIDILLLPTTGTIYTLDQLAAVLKTGPAWCDLDVARPSASG